MCEEKKICCSCKIEKSLDEFTNDKNGKFGKARQCKVCKRHCSKNSYHKIKVEKKSTKKEVKEGETFGYYTIIKEVEKKNGRYMLRQKIKTLIFWDKLSS